MAALEGLPRAFQRTLRRLRLKASVLQLPECMDGCFYNAKVLRPGQSKKETHTIGALHKRSVQSGFIKPDPSSPDRDEQVRSGQIQLLDAYEKPHNLDP